MIFVGGRTGVFRMLIDEPAIWSEFGGDLPEAPVYDLDYDPVDDVLVAGTLGRGAWLAADISGPIPIGVNEFVSAEPIESTFLTASDTAGCPAGFAGKFSFEAKLTNIGSGSLRNLIFQVAVLTEGNLVQNADEGPSGVGGTLTVPAKNDYSDGLLTAGEFVDVPFVTCLKEMQPFQFFVDVLGLTGR
jgi:hypothetical protein